MVPEKNIVLVFPILSLCEFYIAIVTRSNPIGKMPYVVFALPNDGLHEIDYNRPTIISNVRG